MRPLDSYSDETWDRFFDFIYEGDEDLPIEEVEQRLRDAGIDMAPAFERLHKAIEAARANETGRP